MVLWDFLKREDDSRERSSHKLVEMTSNRKTPKRIRGGDDGFAKLIDKVRKRLF